MDEAMRPDGWMQSSSALGSAMHNWGREGDLSLPKKTHLSPRSRRAKELDKAGVGSDDHWERTAREGGRKTAHGTRNRRQTGWEEILLCEENDAGRKRHSNREV